MLATKYIFVTGGVVSSIGKGIATASLGRLLRNRGYSVAPIKLDPYINVDAGTMNPYQHGEVFVTEDGAETDLDLGHYERFMDVNCSAKSSITTGKVYQRVIEKERNGDYLGATVQVIPHVTTEIKDGIKEAGKDVEIVIAEIGGTVGDIESLPFMEAIRQFKNDVGVENCMYIHVTLIPQVGPWNEIKTKPTQHSVIKLREIGIAPDVLICRTESDLADDVKAKLSMFCDVPKGAVVESKTVKTVYEIPLLYEKLGLGDLVVNKLRLPVREKCSDKWESLVLSLINADREIKITAIGKYTENGDAYKSITEACIHAGIQHNTKVTVDWVKSDDLDNSDKLIEILKNSDALLVGPGFGGRGIEGKLAAVKYARENNLPFLGICLGMQCAVIEYARNVCGLKDAVSEEMDENAKNKLIHYMPNQKYLKQLGATMRLGSYECILKPNSLANRLYGSEKISDRHRHRYEVNNEYRETLEKNGLVISGTSPDGNLVEIVELENHPYFIATQAHPEFKSRPDSAHPLFRGLVESVLNVKVNTCCK